MDCLDSDYWGNYRSGVGSDMTPFERWAQARAELRRAYYRALDCPGEAAELAAHDMAMEVHDLYAPLVEALGFYAKADYCRLGGKSEDKVDSGERASVALARLKQTLEGE
jgi:hypothetical protein